MVVNHTSLCITCCVLPVSFTPVLKLYCLVVAKFHYTGPTGYQTRPDKIRGLCLVGSGQARLVEFSYNEV